MDVDTIASLSTAPGVGAIAIVRVSGPSAGAVLMALCPERTDVPDPRSPVLTEIADPDDGSPIDRVIATYFEGPASYTGEDLVELSCHGGWLIPEMVLDACLRAGARRAEPGEFTRRAYLRGKLDLVQAEAVADLIGARSRAMHRAALGQLERGLSRRVSELRQELLRLEALLAHHIDFPEEDEPPVPIDRVVAEAAGLIRSMDAMLVTAPEGELMREGALTVFAGRPNVGKSSLYNALLGVDRAIVTEHAGTTRDALEATVQLAGFPFRLVDTAGLREGGGEVEMLGIEVARRYVEHADLVVLCVPADEGLAQSDHEFLDGMTGTPVVLVETKGDLVEVGDVVTGGPAERLAGTVRVSVVSGAGLDDFKRLLPRLVFSTVVEATADTPLLTRERHARALAVARREVEAFRIALLEGLPAEVAATHLLPAATALEEMLGVVSVDDVLDVVFREFCVGK